MRGRLRMTEQGWRHYDKRDSIPELLAQDAFLQAVTRIEQ
jgi:hypothetical protein